MGYLLGVDLGTTYSAAAIASAGRVASFGLGNQSHVIPSVVALSEDGDVLIGDSAARQSRVEPGAAAREFKRRFGDTTPFLLRGTPLSAEALTGRLLEWIVQRVSEVEGGPPEGIRLTHPANWGPYQVDLLGEAARLRDVGPVSFMTEPEAAAIHYASLQRIAEGELVAVYDLGGGTFDASVLRREGDGFSSLGRPEGIARLGGIDFDEAVFGHVSRSLGDAWGELDHTDPGTVVGLARLRRDCVAAKEDLSARTSTSIDVVLPGLATDVRLTRAEFESLIAIPIEETIAALRRALAAADVSPADINRVLLVGGSSRVPLVAQMVSSALERPVAVDAHPKYAVSMGAAIALEISGTGLDGVMPVVESTPTDVPLATGGTAEESLRVPLPEDEPEPVTPPVVDAPPAPEPVVAAAAVPRVRPKRVFPTTRQATVLLVLGVLVFAAALAWAFLADTGTEGVPADDVAIDAGAG